MKKRDYTLLIPHYIVFITPNISYCYKTLQYCLMNKQMEGRF